MSTRAHLTLVAAAVAALSIFCRFPNLTGWVGNAMKTATCQKILDSQVAFDQAIGDAESLLRHCKSLGNPLPQSAEAFKRAGLVMALTAWQTHVEDRLREKLGQRTSFQPTHAETFMSCG